MTKPIPEFPFEIILSWKAHQLDFPLDWSPDTARAVLRTVAQIEEKIWSLYGDDIIEMERRDRLYLSSPPPNAAADPVVDDFPF